MDRFGTGSVLLTLLVVFVLKVCGEVCPDTDNVYCDYDQYCCGSSCCYLDNTSYYDYGFWNIWYFWFIIFFILMTCCGGCGFYRRRQAYLNQNRTVITNQPIVIPPPRQQGQAPMGGYPQQPVPEGAFQGPPSYNEAVSKPYLYPKSDTVYPPPTMPVNGASPMPPTNPAYPPNPAAYPPPNPAYPAPNPAYPAPNPAYPPAATYYQSGMPMPQQDQPISPPVDTPAAAPPPYTQAEANITQATAPPTAS